MEQVQEEQQVINFKKQKAKREWEKTTCNVCSKRFKARNRYTRTCDSCKAKEFRKYYEPVTFMVQ